MPKPPTFLDSEILHQISEFWVGNGRLPTVAEVKKFGACKSDRAARILREAKGNEFPSPSPSHVPNKNLLSGVYDQIIQVRFRVIWSKVPPWIRNRLEKAGAIDYEL